MKQTLLTNGRRIAYYGGDRMQGLPLVLLHGFCEDVSVWERMLPGFSDLPVVQVDTYGFRRLRTAARAGDGCLRRRRMRRAERSFYRTLRPGRSFNGRLCRPPVRKKYTNVFPVWGFSIRIRGKIRRIARITADRASRCCKRGKRDLYVAVVPQFVCRRFCKNAPEIISKLIAMENASAPKASSPRWKTTARKDHYPKHFAPASPAVSARREIPIIPADEALQAAVLPGISDVHVFVGRWAAWGMFEAPEKVR